MGSISARSAYHGLLHVGLHKHVHGSSVILHCYH